MTHTATILLIGELCESPRRIGDTKDKKPIVRFLVRCMKTNKTDYYPVTAWRGLAENCLEQLHKGDLVEVKGDARTSSYTKDGIKCHGIEISADDVTFLGGNEK